MLQAMAAVAHHADETLLGCAGVLSFPKSRSESESASASESAFAPYCVAAASSSNLAAAADGNFWTAGITLAVWTLHGQGTADVQSTADTHFGLQRHLVLLC